MTCKKCDKMVSHLAFMNLCKDCYKKELAKAKDMKIRVC